MALHHIVENLHIFYANQGIMFKPFSSLDPVTHNRSD
jgi:hypothetical protein